MEANECEYDEEAEETESKEVEEAALFPEEEENMEIEECEVEQASHIDPDEDNALGIFPVNIGAGKRKVNWEPTTEEKRQVRSKLIPAPTSQPTTQLPSST